MTTERMRFTRDRSVCTLDEAVAILGQSRGAVRRLIDQGALRAEHRKGCTYLDRRAVEARAGGAARCSIGRG